MRQPIRSMTAAACLTLACLSPCALAQYDPLQDAPLRRENPTRWVVNAQVDLSPNSRRRVAYDSNGLLQLKFVPICVQVGEWAGEIAIEFAEMQYPIVRGSAGHQTDPESVGGSFRVKQKELTDQLEPVFLGDQQLEYMHFSLERLMGGEGQITLSIDMNMLTFETRYNEERGASIPWPSVPYPDEAARFLLPQRWIQSHDRRIVELAKEWVGPEGPGDSPALLAKRFAAKLLERHQLVGFNLRIWGSDQSEEYYRVESCYQRPRIDSAGQVVNPRLVGFDIVGAAAATETEFISVFDFTNIYVAVCRAAGIPARLMIGFDQTEDAIRHWDLPLLRPWAEIYLYDEAQEQGWWIPVDVVRQREHLSRAPPVEQAWPFFGNHEHLDETLPIAHAYHPPEGSVDNVVPGLWGWFAGPTLPPALAINSQLRFSATHQSVRSIAP